MHTASLRASERTKGVKTFVRASATSSRPSGITRLVGTASRKRPGSASWSGTSSTPGSSVARATRHRRRGTATLDTAMPRATTLRRIAMRRSGGASARCATASTSR